MEPADRRTSADSATGQGETEVELAEPELEMKSSLHSERAAVTVAPPSKPSAPEPAHDLRGRVVLIEQDGTEHSNVVGSLTCRRWVDLVPESLDVPIVGGAWILPGDWLAAAKALSFKGLQLGAQRALIEDPIGLITAPFKAEMVLRARILPYASLRVVGADTGVDLQSVTLLSSNSFDDGELRHPGLGYESRILVSELRSPIILEDPLFPRRRFGGSKSARLFVGAPGYAWREVTVDFGAGGELLLQLERGTELALLVRGFDPRSHARLRLRASEADFDEPVLDAALKSDGLVRFSGLPPGAYRAAAEVGVADEPTLVLGLVALDLRVGKLTEATLEVGARASQGLANAGGLVLVPEAWNVESLALRLDLLDESIVGFDGARTVQTSGTQSPLEGHDAFAWTAGELQVGSYQLSVSDPAYGEAIILPPGGRDDFQVRVPPPAEVLVRVVELPSGAAVDPDFVIWSRGNLPNSIGQAAERVGFGAFELRAPVARIELWVRSSAHLPHSETLELTLGLREHTVALERACGVVIRLLDGALPVAFPEEEGTVVWNQGGASGHGIPIGRIGAFEQRFMMATPGTYSFRVPEVPGFEPVPRQQVEILAGMFIEHAVQLVRKP